MSSRLLYLAICGEFREIVRSPAVVMVLLGGVVLYGVLYNLLYAPNVVREAPIVVVNESNSHLSRTLIHLIDASPSAEVMAVYGNPSEGQRALRDDTAQAMVYLPRDFAERIGRGEQGIFITLSTTATLLYYEATAGAVADAMLALNDEVRDSMVWMLPEEVRLSIANRQQINTEGITLFNPSKGYADYLIPVVLVVIVFQTLVMAVTMVAGRRRATGRSLLRGAKSGYLARATIVVGRCTLHTAIYTLLGLFLLGLIPRLFGLPHLAPATTLVALFVPLVLATSFFAQAFGRLFADSDAPILVITFFSVGLIFLAGISFPLALMPTLWQVAHYLLPAPPAILAFVKAEAMGAPLSAITPQIATLWLQTVIYFLLATLPKGGFR